MRAAGIAWAGCSLSEEHELARYAQRRLAAEATLAAFHP